MEVFPFAMMSVSACIEGVEYASVSDNDCKASVLSTIESVRSAIESDTSAKQNDTSEIRSDSIRGVSVASVHTSDLVADQSVSIVYGTDCLMHRNEWIGTSSVESVMINSHYPIGNEKGDDASEQDDTGSDPYFRQTDELVWF